MWMDEIIKITFDILSFSCIMVLIVSGLAIIASLMGIFNFAHGEFVLLGAYTTYLFQEAGLPVWAGMLVAPFVVGAKSQLDFAVIADSAQQVSDDCLL